VDPDRRAARRRRATVLGPLVLAIVQTVGTFGTARAQPDRRAPDLLAVLVAVAGPAALTLVRRHPVPVLAWVAALTSLYLLRDYPYGPVLASMVVAVRLALGRGHRVAARVATAAVVAAHEPEVVALTGAALTNDEIARRLFLSRRPRRRA